jgi:enterochelin esterase-like enzyme
MRRSLRGFVPGFLLALTLALTACGAGAPARPYTGAAGSSGTGGTRGAAGDTATAGSAGGAATAGTTGAAGDAGTGGTSAGAGAGGAAGSVDAGDRDAAGALDSNRSATMGTQADPGIVGDGKFMQIAPYNEPPEALSLMNGAPQGQLMGPLTYAQTGAYANWGRGWIYRYWIYVPAQYKAGHRAALMVFQDAIHYVQDPIHYLGPKLSDAKFYTATVFDNLIAAGDMPVTIGLFADPGEPPPSYPYNGQEGPNRGRQYDTPNDQFGKFLTEELIPNAVLKTYDIVEDPEGWAICGHSSGGIAAFMAAWYYPDKFRKVLTHSASFPNTNGSFPMLITTTPAKPIRVYLLSGTNDLGNGAWFSANTEAATDLGAKMYHYRFASGTDMHFPPQAGAADFPSALRWLWRGYKTPP